VPSASGGRYVVADGERSRTQESLMPCAQEMSLSGEQVVDDGVDGKKALGMRARFEASHLALALASGLV
jgi:hypothetical protein